MPNEAHRASEPDDVLLSKCGRGVPHGLEDLCRFRNRFFDPIEALVSASGPEAGCTAIKVETGASIAANSTALFPTASPFKVSVRFEIFARARSGQSSFHDRTPYGAEHHVVGPGVMRTLETGIAPTIQDLMSQMIIFSDNTAT